MHLNSQYTGRSVLLLGGAAVYRCDNGFSPTALAAEVTLSARQPLQPCRHGSTKMRALGPEGRAVRPEGIFETRSYWKAATTIRSEEHTSELQSPCNLL